MWCGRAPATLNHEQPGDPDRLAQASLTLVEAEEPPLRLPLGTDAVARIEDKNAFVERRLDAWRELATSTDFRRVSGPLELRRGVPRPRSAQPSACTAKRTPPRDAMYRKTNAYTAASSPWFWIGKRA